MINFLIIFIFFFFTQHYYNDLIIGFNTTFISSNLLTFYLQKNYRSLDTFLLSIYKQQSQEPYFPLLVCKY